MQWPIVKALDSQSLGVEFKTTGWLQVWLPQSMEWVPGTPGELVVKNKLSLCSGFVALSELNPIHKLFLEQ